jgi:alpha-glucosidase
MKWWQSAVFYQIYPRSFLDSDGNGTGDLAGITTRLDYLSETLGVNAIWISPFYESPMMDNGYDVGDYYAIDPLFGTIADFENLIREAKSRNLRVIMDWIPNHTADSHQWFADSRRSRSSKRREWYVWRDSADDGGPPNNWRSFFPRIGSAWTYDKTTGQWYLHSFLPSQPDLNWDNPEVEAAMHDTVRFWLDRGVDGFRIDALPLIGKDPLLRGNPDTRQAWGQYNIDWDTVHDRLRRLRGVCDSYGERIMVGEVNVLDLRRLSMYLSDGDELHLAHSFLFLDQPWNAENIGNFIARMEDVLPPPALPSWYLGNHDNPRVVSRLGGGPVGTARARVAALLLLTLRGVPFIYQGEELGLPDSPVPNSYRNDIDEREPQRVPMPWDAPSRVAGGGFTTGQPWLPLHDMAESLNVSAEVADKDSMLALYRRLIDLRRENDALQAGEFTGLPAPEGIVCFARQSPHRRAVVMLNFMDNPAVVPLALPEAATKACLLVSTNSARSPGYLDLASVELGPHEGLVLDVPAAADVGSPVL